MSHSMRYANNYKGLKRRPEYDEIVDYLHNHLPKVAYPDRTATYLRNTNQISSMLDGEGYSMFDLDMQQQQKMLALLKMGNGATEATEATADDYSPPNLQPGSFALLPPAGISYKAVKLFFQSPEQYNISDSALDKFADLKRRWDDIPYNIAKPKELKEARDLYEEHIYNRFLPIASASASASASAK